jgi:hypothetical protein
MPCGCDWPGYVKALLVFFIWIVGDGSITLDH